MAGGCGSGYETTSILVSLVPRPTSGRHFILPALEDSSEDTGGSTSYGYLTPSKESEKSPRAFSGKGHSLLPTFSNDTG